MQTVVSPSMAPRPTDAVTVIKLEKTPAKEAIEAALQVLMAGGVVAYPTETFYALGTKFDSELGIEKIIRLKARPEEKPISLIIGDRGQLEQVARDIDPASSGLMDRFWPGALTLLLPAAEGLPRSLVGNQKVAVRMPGESFALRLALASPFPATATSANPSGSPAAQGAGQVVDYFGADVDLLIDGGQTPGGLPSTIADATGGEVIILRHGALEIH